MPVWVKSKTTPAIAISIGRRLQRRLVSKRSHPPCSDSSSGTCPSKYSLPVHTEIPHGPGPMTWIQAATWGGNTWQHTAGCIYPRHYSKQCSALCPPTIKNWHCTAVWHCIKAVSNHLWLQPRSTCKIQSPRPASILWRYFFFFFFFLRPAPSLSEFLKIQRVNINHQQMEQRPCL